MAKTTLEHVTDLSPEQAFDMVLKSTQDVDKFTLKSEDRPSATIKLKRGWGMTNPQDVTVTIVREGEGSRVSFEVSILALADPIGFTKTSAERFVFAFKEHEAAAKEGREPQKPPKDNKGLIVLAVSVGFFVLMFGCFGCLGIVGNL